MHALVAALPSERTPSPARLARSTPATRHRLVRTLLFLGAVGLRRSWDLRGYRGDGLALLTGRRRAYGYHHTERFLAQVADAGGAAVVACRAGGAGWLRSAPGGTS